jgi:hypothetical protein
MTGNRTHVSKEQYEGIVREMAKDGQRSDRERQVERAHGQDLPSLLRVLHRKHGGNASAVLREMNGRLEGSSVSRPTLYNWLEKYEVGE